MSKKPAHHGEHWTQAQVRQLEKLADQNTPTRVIGLKLGRTEDSVYAKASEESIPLKPTNQSTTARSSGLRSESNMADSGSQPKPNGPAPAAPKPAAPPPNPAPTNNPGTRGYPKPSTK